MNFDLEISGVNCIKLTNGIREKGYKLVCFIRIQSIISSSAVNLLDKASIICGIEILVDVCRFVLVYYDAFDPGVKIVGDIRPWTVY